MSKETPDKPPNQQSEQQNLMLLNGQEIEPSVVTQSAAQFADGEQTSLRALLQIAGPKESVVIYSASLQALAKVPNETKFNQGVLGLIRLDDSKDHAALVAGLNKLVESQDKKVEAQGLALARRITVSSMTKLGYPDISYCSPERMATYIRNVAYELATVSDEPVSEDDQDNKPYTIAVSNLIKNEGFRNTEEQTYQLFLILAERAQEDDDGVEFAVEVLRILCAEDEDASFTELDGPQYMRRVILRLARKYDEICDLCLRYQPLANILNAHGINPYADEDLFVPTEEEE